MYKLTPHCRICKNHSLTPIFSLGEQALTGVFPKDPYEKVTTGPVDLVMCTGPEACGLVQLLQSYDLNEMYGDNYGYRSGLNQSMVEHLQGKVHDIMRLNLLQPGDIVIDIGSNDATTLKSYPQGIYELVGIDPTGKKFADHYPPEIKLIPEFFSALAVEKALGGRKAKIITSFSMFYDLEDPVAFAREIAGTLDPQGIWVLEQSYLPTMLRTNSFDTICHEHLEFYGLKQIQYIAKMASLKVLDVSFSEVNGGSFSIIVAKVDSKHQPNTVRIAKILAEEQSLGLNSIEVFEKFKAQVSEAGKALNTFLEKAKSNGERVCGLGASTKGNVLLQYFNIDASLLSVIGEVNSDKFDRFTPGSLIPMQSEDYVIQTNPDYLLVLPWHFRKFFESHSKLKGQRLVFPLPKFEIVQL
jgi:NDP-4-keto-2,6-dideoxyhexose 3-C-methyltransferase